MIFICTQQRSRDFHNRRQEERASVPNMQTIYLLKPTAEFWMPGRADYTVFVEVKDIGFAASLPSQQTN